MHGLATHSCGVSLAEGTFAVRFPKSRNACHSLEIMDFIRSTDVVTFQCRSKSLLWRGIRLFSCRLVPFLIPPLAPTLSLEPSLRLLLPRFPQPSQSSLWKFRLPQ